MKTLNFYYEFQTEFKEDINTHYYSLKCLPKTEERQRIEDLKVYINSDYCSISYDCFGNKMLYGYKEKKHNLLDVKIKGKAYVDWQYYDTDNKLATVYSLYTPYTNFDESMLPLVKECENLFYINDTNYQKALKVMSVIYNFMTYEKGITNMNTLAKEAVLLKKGVCQDYSHIMLSILRYFKIPCRYVSGLLKGEVFTHSWVEVYSVGRWYGLDPTNNLLIDNNYIVFARGRDAKDTLVNKGIFYGTSKEQVQKIEIKVWRSMHEFRKFI